MKIAVYSFSENFTLQLAVGLIPKGIEPIEIDKVENLLLVLQNDMEIPILLTESPDLAILEKAREIRPKIHIFLIIHSSFKPQELIKLSKVGITALIDYAENANTVIESVTQNIIKHGIRVEERRAHIRVTPSAYEQATASIYVKNINRFIQSSLIDISAGGIAVKILDSLDASIVVVGNVYEPIFLHITGMDIKCQAKLMGKRNDIAGFKYESVEEKEMNKIASYIHNRIMENSKKNYDSMLLKAR